MMFKTIRALIVAVPLAATALSAQTPAADPSARLREVLPADVAERVIARIAEARSRELPAQALENRALKFAARGVAPADIERAINEHVDRQSQARSALATGRPERPRPDEVEAGAEAMRQGVDGEAVSALARSAPSGRSLAVPLFVVGSLVDRGLPSDEALQRVLERMQERATDAELERLPSGVPRGTSADGPRRVAPPNRPGEIPRNPGPPAGPGRDRPTTTPVPAPAPRRP
jgi:hypothetical protein